MTVRGGGPLRKDGLIERGWPFAAALLIAVVWLFARSGTDHLATMIWVAAAMTAVIAACAYLPWDHLPTWAQAVPPITLIFLIAALRDAGGGAESGLSVAYLLPVLWLSIYGTARQVACALGAVCVAMAVPYFVFGGDKYPPADMQRLMLTTIVGAMTAWAILRSRREATKDPLTTLDNRRAFFANLRAEMARCDRLDLPLSVAVLDLDEFKQFNDTYGHRAGDRMLARAARNWKGQLREIDHIGRIGGEEFAIVLVNAAAREAALTVERVRAATPATMTCSAGVAEWDGNESDVELVHRADVALYRAKWGGRNLTRIAGPPQRKIKRIGTRRTIDLRDDRLRQRS